jgi:hypothetical protein
MASGSGHAIDIPQRRDAVEDAPLAVVPDPRAFVGSPDALPFHGAGAGAGGQSLFTSTATGTPSTIYRPFLTPQVPPLRPELGRSVSSAVGEGSAPGGGRRVTLGAGPVRTVRRVASRLMRVSEREEQRPAAPDREWSLFEQRMTNEGQLRRSGVDVDRSPTMARARRTAVAGAAGALSVSPALEGILAEREGEGAAPLAVSPAAESVRDPFDSVDLRRYSQAPSYRTSSIDSFDERSILSVAPVEPPAPPPRPVGWRERWIPALSPLQKNIFKCGVAYFLGSLFTFNPYLSDIIARVTASEGPSPTGHMVATVYGLLV